MVWKPMVRFFCSILLFSDGTRSSCLFTARDQSKETVRKRDKWGGGGRRGEAFDVLMLDEHMLNDLLEDDIDTTVPDMGHLNKVQE